jgi:hypothetical protein
MTLREIAHSRTGDKGRIVNLSVIAYDARDYPRLVRFVTAERVAAQVAGSEAASVVRYELPELGALNFVLRRGPRESVTQSLAQDAHGKSLSSRLLELEIPEETGAV